MKKLLILVLTLLLSANAFCDILDSQYGSFSYAPVASAIKACRATTMGCTSEQEIEIAKLNGTMLSAYDLNNYLAQDTAKSIFIPLELTNSELLTLAAATSLGVIAFSNDQEIMDVVQRNKTQTTAKIETVGNFIGSSTGVVSIAAGSYFLGVLFKDNKLKKVGLFMVGAGIAQAIVTEGVKNIFGRVRPREGLGPYEFFQDGNKSFFSGHTAGAFSLATVISEMYKDEYPMVPWIAYGVASITAYARMHANAHWASDVLIGAVAGHLITKLAMSMMNGNKEGRGGLEIFPGIDPNSGSYMIYGQWMEKENEVPYKCDKMPEGNLKIEACFSEIFNRAAKKY